MSARPEQLPPTQTTDVFIRDCEHKALQRLAKLTESENERVALRACEVVLKYAAERRREWRASDPPPAKTDPKPPAPATPKVKVPEALIHPPAPKPAFRAVPLGFDSPGHSG